MFFLSLTHSGQSPVKCEVAPRLSLISFANEKSEWSTGHSGSIVLKKKKKKKESGLFLLNLLLDLDIISRPTYLLA